jgi:hypothetical protein
MRAIAVVLLIAGTTAWAQRATSPSGFGRIANPGGVTSTTGGAGFGRIVYPGTGAPAASRTQPGVSVFPALKAPPAVSHGVHAGPVIVPYPVFYGGGYYDYDAPSAQMAAYPQPGDQMQASPVVIINQYFRPDTANPILNDYSNVPLPQGVPRGPDGQPQASAEPPPAQDTQPIMFLIAMKDHTIFPALAYWVEGDTLNYITTQGTKNSASLDLVDRPFSQQLNRERKVEFGLPEKK